MKKNVFRMLVYAVALVAMAVPASAQKPVSSRTVTLGGMWGMVKEQQAQLDDFNKKLSEAEARLIQAVESCKKQAAAAAQMRQSSAPAPAPSMCDHADLEKQINALRRENDRVKRRIKILENAIAELQAAHRRGEKHRKQLAEALAAVQREFPQQIAGLSTAVAKLEHKVGTVEQAVSSLNIQYEDAQRTLKSYAPRIASLESRSLDQQAAIRKLAERNKDFQRHIHLSVVAESWAVRAGYAVGGGAYLQIPLGDGVCSVVFGGAAGWRKGNDASYAAQLMGRCGRSVHVRFGGLALFGESKTVGGTLGVGYSRRFFTVYADGGPGAEKLGGQEFRITYMVKGGLGLHF